MSLKQSAENAIFNYPKDTANQPSMQEVADIFANANHSRATVALLVADVALSYTAGAAAYVATGDYIRVWNGNHVYQVAASGASDQHLTTAGSVKLYALPAADGSYAVESFNISAARTAAQNTTALALLLTLATHTTQLSITFSGKYPFVSDGSLTCENNITIRGIGRESGIEFTSGTGHGLIWVANSGEAGVDSFIMENMCLDIDGSNNGRMLSLTGETGEANSNVTLRDVLISTPGSNYFDTGIYCESIRNALFDNVRILGIQASTSYCVELRGQCLNTEFRSCTGNEAQIAFGGRGTHEDLKFIQTHALNCNDGFNLDTGAWPTVITAATKANPCQITSVAHDLTTGDEVYITGVAGMTELNGNSYTVTVVDVDNVTLDSTDSTSYTTYTSAGTIELLGTTAEPALEISGCHVSADVTGIQVGRFRRSIISETTVFLTGTTGTVTGIILDDKNAASLTNESNIISGVMFNQSATGGTYTNLSIVNANKVLITGSQYDGESGTVARNFGANATDCLETFARWDGAMAAEAGKFVDTGTRNIFIEGPESERKLFTYSTAATVGIVPEDDGNIVKWDVVQGASHYNLNLNDTPASYYRKPGYTVHITRTAASTGAGECRVRDVVGGVQLVALAVSEWCTATWDGTNFYLSGFGTGIIAPV